MLSLFFFCDTHLCLIHSTHVTISINSASGPNIMHMVVSSVCLTCNILQMINLMMYITIVSVKFKNTIYMLISCYNQLKFHQNLRPHAPWVVAQLVRNTRAAAPPDDNGFNLVVSLDHLFLCMMNPISYPSDSSEFVGLIFPMQTKTKSIVWI